MTITPRDVGWIEVICGSMFSGKTEELIRRLRRAQIARMKVAIFKPSFDTRYGEAQITSHNQQSLECISVQKPEEILELAREAEVLGIDEAQFFDQSIVKVCQQLARDGKRVIVAGLDKDYRGEPFEPIPELLAEAEYITKTLAICVKCGNPASFTQRITPSKERLLLGATDIYEARCRKCFQPPNE